MPFGKADIQVYYVLRNIEYGEYEAYLENVDYDEVIQTLSIERAE